MNVVDSSAWLCWIADDENAQHFARPILDVDSLLIPTITLTEVFKSMLRQTNETQAMRALTLMKQGKLVPLDDELAVDAAVYGTQLSLPLADSIVYATARRHGAMLWTQDGDFRDLPGVTFFAREPL